jgi:hypothetical protein
VTRAHRPLHPALSRHCHWDLNLSSRLGLSRGTAGCIDVIIHIVTEDVFIHTD